MNIRTIRIGVVGLGTVGAALVESLQANAGIIRADVGAEVVIARIAEKDATRRKSIHAPGTVLSLDWRDLVADRDIDIVVELMGGTSAARDLVLASLRAGKHVITANKALLANHWTEVLTEAHKAGRAVGFEASVMAGVPVIHVLQSGLSGHRISAISGILNGTSNFILTRIGENGVDRRQALEEARQKGFCEADPSLDLEGFDAAQKLAILGSLVLGRWLPPQDVHREGIGNLEKEDLLEARNSFGYVLKPLAILKRRATGVEARVQPTFLDKRSPLAEVSREFNALLIESDAAGPITLIGKGAGGAPAASGVLADIVEIARRIRHADSGASVPRLPRPGPVHVLPYDQLESRFFLRFTVCDRPGVLSKIFRCLSSERISIANSEIRNTPDGATGLVYAATYRTHAKAVRKALKTIDVQPALVKRKTLMVPIQE